MDRISGESIEGVAEQQQTKHATGHGVALSESLTTEDIMKRNARRHLVQDVSKKLNDALDMYHARQEEWEEEEAEDEEEHVHIGEAANIVSMFKQAAAGAMNDEDEDTVTNSKELERGEEIVNYEGHYGAYVDGFHSLDMSEDERARATHEFMAKPKVLQYLETQLRLMNQNVTKDHVEIVDTHAFTGKQRHRDHERK